MAKVLLKKSSVPSNAPSVLEYGEVAINYADGRLYYKNSSNVIKNFIDSDLVASRIAAINHDNLIGFVANEHIDHSTVSISAGTGLTGGGTIAANRTISHSDTSALSGTYGSTEPDVKINQITVDGFGHITAITTGSIASASRSFVTYEYLADSGQTTFSDSDLNGAVLSYSGSNIIVSLNGIILQPGEDYTASNGISIVLDSAVSVNDILQVQAFDIFTIADAVPASTGGTFNAGITVNGTMTATTFSGAGTSLTGISSANFDSAQSLIIYNSSGVALKTLYGAGS
jgi:hypothetical protein